MEEEKIPTRADIPDSDKWDLTHLFSDVGKWNEDVEWITRTYPRITEWKGRVAESPQTLARVLEFEKQLDLKIERVSHFARHAAGVASIPRSRGRRSGSSHCR